MFLQVAGALIATAGPLSQLAWHKIRFERTDSGIDILGANPGLFAEESAVGRREKSPETVSEALERSFSQFAQG